MREKKRENLFYIHALLIVYSVLLMLICAGSSPLINYLSPDSASFLLFGRCMGKGQILYRDIMQHKGFYTLYINYVAAIISPNSMLGVFVIEIVFNYFKMFFVMKITAIYTEDKKKQVLVAVLFMAVADNFFLWNTGDLGETFALPFWLCGFYLMALYAEKNKKCGG